MKIPKAGKRTKVAERFGRALYEQEFLYSDWDSEERVEVYSMWAYEKGMPCLVFPVTKDRQVVAVRQYRHGSNALHLETPGGLPKGEQDPIEVVRQELLEETGYEADLIVRIGHDFWVDAAAHNLRFRAFFATNCVKVAEPKLDRTEVMETVLVPVEDWYDKVFNGQINDGKVMAISILALPLLATTRIRFCP